MKTAPRCLHKLTSTILTNEPSRRFHDEWTSHGILIRVFEVHILEADNYGKPECQASKNFDKHGAAATAE